jgi:hypothetical protein
MRTSVNDSFMGFTTRFEERVPWMYADIKVSTVLLTFLLVMAGSSSAIAADVTSWLSLDQLDAIVEPADSRPAASLSAAGAIPSPALNGQACTMQVLRTENSPGASFQSGVGSVSLLQTENGPGALLRTTDC